MELQTRNKKQRLTIKDIALLAGVSKTAVSGVLNNKSRVGPEKEKKILDVIRKHNYVPQVSARALSNRRTYQIGYLVSSKVTLGLANAYFATIEAGVNKACQDHGYQMVVSTYDLSTIKNFVMPKKLMQRSVDALVIAGNVDSNVLTQLKTLQIPYIIIGGKYDDEDVLCLRSDMGSTYLKMIDYFANLGHKLVCFEDSNPFATKDFMGAAKNYNFEGIKTIFKKFDAENDFKLGVKHAQYWIKQDKDERYTAFIANDQICAGFLSELVKNDIKCPDEISIMACSGTTMCEWSPYPISASMSPQEKHGNIAATLLIELLDKKKNLKDIRETLQKEYKHCDLIIRSTTGKAPATAKYKICK